MTLPKRKHHPKNQQGRRKLQQNQRSLKEPKEHKEKKEKIADISMTMTEEDRNVFTNIDQASNKGKKLAIEDIYQKKSQLEHILLRPDTYIGSVEYTEKTVPTFLPISAIWGAHPVRCSYSLFDSVSNGTVPSAFRAKNQVSIFNNGKGIPVVHHKVENMYVPEMIFGTLLTSSNYDDSERKVTGGRNGYGAKLCNIFSTEFTLETSSKEYGKAFKQTWINNMTKDKEPQIVKATGDDYTKITFKPDLKKFKMSELDDDIIAKTLAVSGLGVVGRDRYGVFPLRGKLLNVREGNIKQDQDGSHIKGLVINFIHHNWPSLIQRNFVEEFITPIVKASKGKEELSFFSIPEYNEWRNNTENWKSYKIKYYKGLGTSTSKEAKEYFSDMVRHRIKFKYGGVEDDNAVDMAFSKKKIEERKDWLTKWMAEKKERRARGLEEEYLYNKDTRAVTFSDFVNKELVLFSNTDNERSIPSLVDGFKPGQRKVMFACFKRADKREVKVAQLAGAVGELSAYHHGEMSLMGTIINLAQVC
ncbi:hypothetical protein COOONC_24593 [Cooperia oncophora]